MCLVVAIRSSSVDSTHATEVRAWLNISLNVGTAELARTKSTRRHTWVVHARYQLRNFPDVPFFCTVVLCSPSRGERNEGEVKRKGQAERERERERETKIVNRVVVT